MENVTLTTTPVNDVFAMVVTTVVDVDIDVVEAVVVVVVVSSTF